MKAAKLIRSKVKTNMFDLVIDGRIYGDQVYNKYHFTATGKNADGSAFDTAAELGITKINFDEYNVADVEKFLAWTVMPTEKAIAIYGVEDGIN